MKCKVFWVYWFLGITIFLIDRITKNAALSLFLKPVDSGLPGLSYETMINRGMSWGLLSSSQNYIFLSVSLVIVAVTAFVGWWAYISYKNDENITGHICIIAGSLSNIFDRIVYAGVIDFIIISFRGYSWPVFNIADMAIVFGIGVILWQQYGR